MTDRRPLQSLTYGMYIVGAREGERMNGQLSNTVFQTTSEPPMLSVCVNHQNVTHGMIKRSGRFCVSVLDVTAPFTFISLFGFRHGDKVDKLAGVPHRTSKAGLPVVTASTNAYLEAVVVGSVEAVTHTVFLGQVTDMEILGEGVSMTYDYYRTVLKGLTPRSAPTFAPPVAVRDSAGDAYRVSDPALGTERTSQ
ncbi:MAG: flavin reductase family protein [Methanomassiliicoccus sp.]|nr:flavin reductase family protein [Methanomassiliicoccus sp.]